MGGFIRLIFRNTILHVEQRFFRFLGVCNIRAHAPIFGTVSCLTRTRSHNEYNEILILVLIATIIKKSYHGQFTC